jgi:hypothetical protein
MELLLDFFYCIEDSVMDLNCDIIMSEKKILDLILGFLAHGETFELNYYCIWFYLEYF